MQLQLLQWHHMADAAPGRYWMLIQARSKSAQLTALHAQAQAQALGLKEGKRRQHRHTAAAHQFTEPAPCSGQQCSRLSQALQRVGTPQVQRTPQRLQATHATLQCLNACNASLLRQCQDQAAIAAGLTTFVQVRSRLRVHSCFRITVSTAAERAVLACRAASVHVSLL
jgi:hypothetical protein